jgi:hypothetical protein
MTSSTIIALLLSCAVFSFGPYLVWPSRWNVVGHFQLGFFVVAYLIPLLWTDPAGSAGHSSIYLYSSIMAWGACFYLLGLPFGFFSPRYSLTGYRLLAIPQPEYARLFRDRVVKVAFWSTFGLLLSFAIMGYVPMFAADPLEAKYFHGAYQAGFLRAAVLFKPSFFAFVSYLPLFTVICKKAKRARYSLLLLIGLAAAAGYLRRGEIGIPLIAGVGILVAEKRSLTLFASYLAVVICVVWIGTLANYLLSAYLSIKTGHFEGIEASADLIADGAPDVKEGLLFFDSFEHEGEPFTYGAQFLGGLIPEQSLTVSWIPLARYNPGFWAEGVMYGTQDQDFIRNSGGGGLRIEVPISGYCAFGWIGAIVMSALSGFLTGYLARFAKRYAGQGSLEQSAVVVSMYLALYQFAGDPCAMVLLHLMPVIALAWLIYPMRIHAVPIQRAWAVPQPALL